MVGVDFGGGDARSRAQRLLGGGDGAHEERRGQDEGSFHIYFIKSTRWAGVSEAAASAVAVQRMSREEAPNRKV